MRTIAVEDYVRGVVAGELAVGAIDRAIVDRMLAVQAIVTRTFALAQRGRHARDGFDLCATTHCQVFRPDHEVLPANRPLVAAAVERTSGQVLVYEDRLIEALFHADCGGWTSSPQTVWGTPPRAYLRVVHDPLCERDPGSSWTFPVDRESVRAALNREARTSIGARLETVQVIERDEGGRAALVALDGERSPIVRGEELRAAMVRQFGARSIRSPRFEVRRNGSQLIFTGRGLGHGVGLCQRGAMRRLQAGASVAEVLTAYYPAARLIAARRQFTGTD